MWDRFPFLSTLSSDQLPSSELSFLSTFPTSLSPVSDLVLEPSDLSASYDLGNVLDANRTWHGGEGMAGKAWRLAFPPTRRARASKPGYPVCRRRTARVTWCRAVFREEFLRGQQLCGGGYATDLRDCQGVAGGRQDDSGGGAIAAGAERGGDAGGDHGAERARRGWRYFIGCTKRGCGSAWWR